MNAHLVQITGEHRQFDGKGWTPWFNCKGTFRDTALLAIHQFIRNAGHSRRLPNGPAPEYEPFTVRVWVADGDGPLHDSGVPLVSHVFEMLISKPEDKHDTVPGQSREAAGASSPTGGRDPGQASQPGGAYPEEGVPGGQGPD